MSNIKNEKNKINQEINSKKVNIDRSVFSKSDEEKRLLKEAKLKYAQARNNN